MRAQRIIIEKTARVRERKNARENNLPTTALTEIDLFSQMTID